MKFKKAKREIYPSRVEWESVTFTKHPQNPKLSSLSVLNQLCHCRNFLWKTKIFPWQRLGNQLLINVTFIKFSPLWFGRYGKCHVWGVRIYSVHFHNLKANQCNKLFWFLIKCKILILKIYGHTYPLNQIIYNIWFKMGICLQFTAHPIKLGWPNQVIHIKYISIYIER